MKNTSFKSFLIISAVIATFITAGNIYWLEMSDPMKIYIAILTGVSIFAIILPILMYIEWRQKKIANKYDFFIALFCLDNLVLIETFVLTFYSATVSQGKISNSMLFVVRILLYISFFIFFLFIMNTIIEKAKEIKQK